MAIPHTATILHHLRQTVLRQGGVGLSDGQLLRSFLYRGDEAAFEALVRRHGPMVRGVCRRILRNLHDADDAFQAAFLVLLRKASTLASREVLGDWLHGVAYRTALKARTAAARRRLKEMQALRREAIVDEPERSEWLPLLDQEISRLPPKYRLPVVLCDLEGRTRKEAAQQLGWPEGTLSGRLSRARAMLAQRLIRRGVTLSAAALAAGLAGEASARLPFSLVGSTCKTAMEFASPSAAGSVPANVAALTEGVVKAMFVAKMKKITAVVMAALVLAAGAGAWRYAAVAGQGEEQRQKQSLPPKQGLPKAAEPKDREKIPTIPATKRLFPIDLRLTQVKDGKRNLLASPRLITLEGSEGIFGMGKPYGISVGAGQIEKINKNATVKVKARTDEGGKIKLDMTLSQPIFEAIDAITAIEIRSVRVVRSVEPGQPSTVKLQTGDNFQNFLEVTASIQEAEDESDKITIAAAEKDLKRAEFYFRSGKLDSASFYYELIRRRYPDTIYAERAKERLAELNKPKEKPPARVGQIFLRGNKKIADEVILNGFNFYPGMVLPFQELHIVERKITQLKGIKSAQVSVIDREGAGVFKDILIQVEEK